MEWAPGGVYLLCLATCLFCVVLLVRGYIRTRGQLLFWTALCFVGLAVNNLLLFIDLAILPAVDLSVPRHLSTLAAIGVLLYGFIWQSE